MSDKVKIGHFSSTADNFIDDTQKKNLIIDRHRKYGAQNKNADIRVGAGFILNSEFNLNTMI